MQTGLFRRAYVLAAITIVLLYSACLKPENPEVPAPPCKVMAYIGVSDQIENGYNQGELAYNAAGNPIRRTLNVVKPPYYTNLEFRYDALGRLRDKISYYESSAYGERFDKWHRYYYDAKGRIYVDSVFYFGVIGDDPTPYSPETYWTSWTNFTYDAKNRIIRSDVWSPFHVKWKIFEYTYDKDQNLSRVVDTLIEGINIQAHVSEYSYDKSSVNINRTSKVFQFLNADYSVNSQVTSSNLVQYGLPGKIEVRPHGYTPYRIPFLDYDYNALVEITYDCR